MSVQQENLQQEGFAFKQPTMLSAKQVLQVSEIFW